MYAGDVDVVDHLMPTGLVTQRRFGPNISAIYTSNPTITVAADAGYSPRGLCVPWIQRARKTSFAVEKVVSTSRQR